MKKTVHILGSGFSSLAAASYLARDGYEVTVYEKNADLGGRARQFQKDGFSFDMGPTWYWMPDVFERFFADFGKKPSDYYQLIKLNPAYQVHFGPDEVITIGDQLETIIKTFESIEAGSGQRLRTFMAAARENYDIAIKDLVYRPGESPLELVSWQTMRKISQFLGNISADVRSIFKDQRLIQILEFPVLFLGAKPSQTPSFYNFMNYADFGLGTWHPKGGMIQVVRGMVQLARDLGVTFVTNAEVSRIRVRQGKVAGIDVNGQMVPVERLISGADYAHTETLLDPIYRQYSENYWDKRIFAPSALLFYVGFNKKMTGVAHHSLFFDVPFDPHAEAIYDQPAWPENPLFYASFPSKTDPESAPTGYEAGIFLIPLAPGLTDTPALREQYFEKIITRLENLTNQQVKTNILFKESFGISDFISAYNAFKGNAYGLANTLLQTAFLRPNLRSRKVKQLYFTGQLTVPGPGVPPALISGKLTAQLLVKHDI
ncbi:MAG: phytoene dehydrogenase [Flavobacterium sp. BFFFF2]|nr:MAG: phytoene dehydrogenase [Flavobacterium sp. BFFFF2]